VCIIRVKLCGGRIHTSVTVSMLITSDTELLKEMFHALVLFCVCRSCLGKL